MSMPDLLLGWVSLRPQRQKALEYLQNQAVRFSYIHCKRSLTETQESGLSSRTAPQEDIGWKDFSWPEEAELLIDNPSADQEDTGMDIPPPMETEGLGVSSTAGGTFQLHLL